MTKAMPTDLEPDPITEAARLRVREWFRGQVARSLEPLQKGKRPAGLTKVGSTDNPWRKNMEEPSGADKT